MGLDSRPAEHQPHSHPIRLGREERVEYTILVDRRQTRPVIGDGDEHLAEFMALRGDAQKAWFCGAAHGVDGIVDEVGDHLPQLRGIADDEGQVALQLARHQDAAEPGFVPALGQHGVDEMVEIEWHTHQSKSDD